MDLSLISQYGVLAIGGLFVLLGLIWGLVRGMGRSIYRLITLAVAAVIAFFVSTRVLAKIIPSIIQFASPYLLTIFSQYSDLLTSSDALFEYVLQIVISLLTPVLFIVFFLIGKLISWFFYIILAEALPTKRKKPLKGWSRVVGMFISIVSGLLIAATLVVPICGYSSIGKNTIESFEDSGIIAEGLVPEVATTILQQTGDVDYVTKINEKTFPVFLMLLNGYGVFDLEGSKENEDKKFDALKEYENITKLLPTLKAFFSINFAQVLNDTETDLSSLNGENGLINLIDESEIVKETITKVIKSAAKAWADGKCYAGNNLKGDLTNASLDGALDTILEQLSNTTTETIKEDLGAFITALQ